MFDDDEVTLGLGKYPAVTPEDIGMGDTIARGVCLAKWRSQWSETVHGETNKSKPEE